MDAYGLPDFSGITALSGGALFLFIVVMMVALFLTILPLNWAARACGARKTGCFSGLVVVIVSPILEGILLALLGTVLPVIGVILSFLITLCAQALMIMPLYKLGFGKSLLVALLWLVFRIVFFAIIWVVLVLIFSMMGIGLM